MLTLPGVDGPVRRRGPHDVTVAFYPLLYAEPRFAEIVVEQHPALLRDPLEQSGRRHPNRPGQDLFGLAGNPTDELVDVHRTVCNLLRRPWRPPHARAPNVHGFRYLLDPNRSRE